MTPATYYSFPSLLASVHSVCQNEDKVFKFSKNSEHLLCANVYEATHMLFHLMHTTLLKRDYYTQFTDEDLGIQVVKSLTQRHTAQQGQNESRT